MRIVYLHGFISSPGSTKARLFAERMASMGVSLAVPDLNEPRFKELTLTRVIRTAASLLEAGEPGPLMGSSMGGLAATLLASAHPEKIAALVLMAPAFNLAELLEQRLGPDGMERWRSEGTTAFEHPAFEEMQRLEYGFMEDARRWLARPLNVRCPTLILHGRGDEDVPLSLSESFAAKCPNACLVTYEAGHSLEEVTGDVLDRAVAFLEKHVPGWPGS